VTELKISLEDLLNGETRTFFGKTDWKVYESNRVNITVDTRGRWWVVGSAWSGGGAGAKDDDKPNTSFGQADGRKEQGGY
jgi:hypothetical protein